MEVLLSQKLLKIRFALIQKKGFSIIHNNLGDDSVSYQCKYNTIPTLENSFLVCRSFAYIFGAYSVGCTCLSFWKGR